MVKSWIKEYSPQPCPEERGLDSDEQGEIIATQEMLIDTKREQFVRQANKFFLNFSWWIADRTVVGQLKKFPALCLNFGQEREKSVINL